MTALATADDVATVLGRDLTTDEENRVDGLLDAASARFRREARQHISTAQTALVLPVRHGRVRLPQRPVVSVDTVRAVAGDGTPATTIAAWTFDGVDLVTVADWWAVQLNAAAPQEPGTVHVTYSHGHDPVPDDVAYAVAGMTARALAPTAVGVTSETIGGYTYRLGPAAEAGALGMTDDEKAVARSYRRTTGTVVLR